MPTTAWRTAIRSRSTSSSSRRLMANSSSLWREVDYRHARGHPLATRVYEVDLKGKPYTTANGRSQCSLQRSTRITGRHSNLVRLNEDRRSARVLAGERLPVGIRAYL